MTDDPRPKVLCACGHLWSEHRARISFQNDRPVEIGRDECLFRRDPFAPWYDTCRCRSFQ